MYIGKEERGFSKEEGEVVVAVFSLVGQGGWELLIKVLKCLFTIANMFIHRAIKGL
jgi:hypothetical protein